MLYIYLSPPLGGIKSTVDALHIYLPPPWGIKSTVEALHISLPPPPLGVLRVQ